MTAKLSKKRQKACEHVGFYRFRRNHPADIVQKTAFGREFASLGIYYESSRPNATRIVLSLKP